MSSSAVHGDHPSHRQGSKRKQVVFTLIEHAVHMSTNCRINPRPVHDALLNAILFHPFGKILMTSIIWNFPSGSVLDSCFQNSRPKGRAIQASAYLSPAAALASLR